MELDKQYADMATSPSLRVYYPSDPELYVEGSIPLYLNWIVEGADGSLYVVPAEAGGWWKRSQYGGLNEKLEAVSPEKARTILHLVAGSLVASDLVEDRRSHDKYQAKQSVVPVRLEDGEYATGIALSRHQGSRPAAGRH